MEQVQELMQDEGQYTESNCFLFVIICHAMEDGYLIDRSQKKTFKLNELTEKICALSSLKGKAKMILIEEYGCGRSSYLFDVPLLAMIIHLVVQSTTKTLFTMIFRS